MQETLIKIINEKSIDNYEKDEVVWETFEYEE